MLNLNIPTIDLFAGAGGFTTATKMAGGLPVLSVEIDSISCETLETNDVGAKHKVLHADVRKLSGKALVSHANISSGDPFIIIGGPPCQPFSKASYWTDPGNDSNYRQARAKGKIAEKPKPITVPKQDERRSLLFEFHRLVVESNAPAFVMENVRSLLHPRNKDTFQALIKAFEDDGYFCQVVDANAANYGVPQKRKRIFVLGSKSTVPSSPQITHRISNKDPEYLPEATAVGPILEPFSSDKYFEEGEVVKGKWSDALKEIPEGWNYKYLSSWADHPNPIFEAETRFWNFLLKLHPDKPSWTINANPGPWVGPFHWESRRLRTVELAAIQTFPKNYRFSGSRRQKIKQIGNAVPPLLASKMIQSVYKTLVEE